MKFLDLFAGIGGFRLGMEMAGHKCVGYVEWDKFARASYEAIHDTKGEWTAHDITTVTDEEWRKLRGAVDVICGGFPCQAFSIAGERRGFQDTRGTLFFEIARAAEQIKPRFLLLENVKGLLSHDRGGTFFTILSTLDELGYDAEWQVLNSSEYVPQNRERTFVIGHLRGCRTQKIFPIRQNRKDNCQQIASLNIKGTDSIKRVYDPEYISPTLTTCGGGNTEAKIITKYPTTDTVYGNEMRKLTPLEYWRLQGLPDWAFEKAKNTGLSDRQLYKQAGNAVTVNVVYEIAKRLSK